MTGLLKLAHGGIIHTFLTPDLTTEEVAKKLETVDIEQYRTEDDGFQREIWDVIPKPTYAEEIPEEANHYWIIVDGKDTNFTTNKMFHVEIAAEALCNYGKIFVTEGHPKKHYIKPKDCFCEHWMTDTDWSWNPQTLEKHIHPT